MQIQEVTQPLERAHDIHRLTTQLNPEQSFDQFEPLFHHVLDAGYRIAGAYEGERLVAIAGFWRHIQLWCGPYLEIDNVVVDPDFRRQGIARKLAEWLEDEGRRLECAVVLLKVYQQNERAINFYNSLDYSMPGHVMLKPLTMSLEEWETVLASRPSVQGMDRTAGLPTTLGK